MRENARHSRERDDDAVRLWTTRETRRRYDDFATLYALARAIEKLERAYVRSSVDARAYEGACVDLVSKFKALRSVTRESVPDLERFFATYGAAVPKATRRLELGVPATAEHRASTARGTEEDRGGGDALFHRGDGHGEAGHASEGSGGADGWRFIVGAVQVGAIAGGFRGDEVREEMGAADGYHARERVSERGGGEGIFV